jgi:hypothetical protein
MCGNGYLQVTPTSSYSKTNAATIYANVSNWLPLHDSKVTDKDAKQFAAPFFILLELSDGSVLKIARDSEQNQESYSMWLDRLVIEIDKANELQQKSPSLLQLLQEASKEANDRRDEQVCF